MEEEKQMQEEEENCQRGDGADQVVEEIFEKSPSPRAYLTRSSTACQKRLPNLML